MESVMAEVTVSSKFQLVIPREVRRETGLKVGEKMVVIVKDGIINLIPRRRLKDLRGFVKGIDLKGLREDEERL
jgi:AbrB family looped-hinge helix DNA binding protein